MSGVPDSEPELDLEFPPKPEYVRAIRHAVAALARLHDASEDVVEDIKLAVSEACTRAVAVNAEQGAEPVRLLVSVDGDVMAIDVMDRGPAPEREAAGPPGDMDTGGLPFDQGLSLPLIRGLVDQVAITPREGGGMNMRLVVSLLAAS